MNAETYRELEEAMKFDQDYADAIREGDPVMSLEPLEVLVDAARRDLSRWELCPNPKCRDGYLGEHRWEADDGYGGRVEHRQLEKDPRCQGSGVIPNQERMDGVYDVAEKVFGMLPWDVVEPTIRAMHQAFDQTGEPE